MSSLNTQAAWCAAADFGRAAKSARHAVGMSRRALARSSGVHAGIIKMVEYGKMVPNAGIALAMAKKLNIMAEATDYLAAIDAEYRKKQFSVFCDLANHMADKLDDEGNAALSRALDVLSPFFRA